MSTPTTAVQKSTEKEMSFTPFGAADKIRLTVSIIQNIVAVPTKSGKTCTERDALKFMMLCQAQRLNPFAGDAYLVGYDSQNGPSFSLITAHQAFLKRAEASKDFDGMTSGILIRKEDDSIEEREGDFHLRDETEHVVGGWAKVFHKGRAHPTYRRIRMERFNKGFAQWKEDAAGMIVKCAEADALRSTFPTLLGGLYLKEEMEVPATISAPGIDLPRAPIEAEVVSSEPEAKKGAQATPQAELESLVIGNGYTFDTIRKWGAETGNLENADSFAAIPVETCRRLLRAKAGLLKGLEAIKGTEGGA